jgi:hypothetical protein
LKFERILKYEIKFERKIINQINKRGICCIRCEVAAVAAAAVLKVSFSTQLNLFLFFLSKFIFFLCIFEYFAQLLAYSA